VLGLRRESRAPFRSRARPKPCFLGGPNSCPCAVRSGVFCCGENGCFCHVLRVTLKPVRVHPVAMLPAEGAGMPNSRPKQKTLSGRERDGFRPVAHGLTDVAWKLPPDEVKRHGSVGRTTVADMLVRLGTVRNRDRVSSRLLDRTCLRGESFAVDVMRALLRLRWRESRPAGMRIGSSASAV
jgi:hypothetical protein